MKEWLTIIRPVNCVMAAVAVWIASLVAGAATNNTVFMAMASAFFVCAGGMVINDYFDIKTDRVNKPRRPLACGKMKKSSALIYTAILFIIGNAISFFVGYTNLYIALAASLLLIAYAAKLKRTILIGHLDISLLVALLFVFGGMFGNYTYVLPLALLAFLSNTGREIYKSINDVRGDKKNGISTLAVKYGTFRARGIASMFIILAVLFSFLPFLLSIMGYVYLFFVIIADIVFLLAVIVPSHYSERVCKFGMLVALAAFLMGVV